MALLERSCCWIQCSLSWSFYTWIYMIWNWVWISGGAQKTTNCSMECHKIILFEGHWNLTNHIVLILWWNMTLNSFFFFWRSNKARQLKPKQVLQSDRAVMSSMWGDEYETRALRRNHLLSRSTYLLIKWTKHTIETPIQYKLIHLWGMFFTWLDFWIVFG